MENIQYYDIRDIVFTYANVSAILLFITGMYVALRFSKTGLGLFIILISVALGGYDVYNQLISSVPQIPNVKYDLSESDTNVLFIIIMSLGMTVTGVILHDANKRMSEELTQGQASMRLLLGNRKARRFTKRRNLNSLKYDELVNDLNRIADEDSDFKKTEQTIAKDLIRTIYQIKRDCVDEGSSFTLDDIYRGRLRK